MLAPALLFGHGGERAVDDAHAGGVPYGVRGRCRVLGRELHECDQQVHPGQAHLLLVAPH